MSNPKITVVCEHCGNNTEKHQYLVNKGYGKYCDFQCYALSKRSDKNGLKCCAKCKVYKPVGDFSVRNGGYGKRPKAYCMSCINAKCREVARSTHDRFVRSRRSARKRRSLEWTIIESEYEILIKMPCHYCGGLLGVTGCGLDRKDNNLGYTAENVVPCCRRCNVVKNDYFSYDEMLILAPSLKEIQKRRYPSHTP